jgi:hypothetical protein
MRVIALDTHDGHREGDEYDVPEHRALKLIRKGLVKLGPLPCNKMAEACDNKENPTPAVGAAPIASFSPAAPVSQPPTLNASGTGRRRGRPRKTAE